MMFSLMYHHVNVISMEALKEIKLLTKTWKQVCQLHVKKETQDFAEICALL